MPLTQDDRSNLLNLIQQKKLKINPHLGWENFSKTLMLPNSLVLDVANTTALQAIMHELYQMNAEKNSNERIIVRAAAGNPNEKHSSSYSFTAGAEADVIVRLVGDEFHQVEVTADPHVMHVGGSVQIGTLDQILYDKYNLVLATSSLIPYVTVAGLSANAGHGTGKDQPSFAGLIRAMTFCLPNGEIVRIDQSHKDFEVIRGAHLGLFGILLNVEIECIPAKKIQCVMEARSVPQFLQELKEGLFAQDPYVSVMYVPTYQKDELTNPNLKNVIIYRWRPVPKNIKDVNSNPMLSHLAQEFQVKIQEGFQIDELLRLVPSLIPYYMRYLVAKFGVGDKDSISVGPWPTMHYQTAFPAKINDVDYLFPVSKDAHEIAEAFIHVVTELQKAGNKHQYPVNYAIYLRLISGTQGGLSTSSGNKDYICGFDVVSSPGMTGYDAFRNEMTNYFVNNFDAKPHWGKYVPPNQDYQKMYGDNFVRFKTVLSEWYEKNGMQFKNSMLLNNFNSTILQMPSNAFTKIKNFVKQHVTLPKAIPTPKFSKSEMAAKILQYVEGDDLYAEKLRRQLRTVANDYSFFSMHNLFACKNKLFGKKKLSNDSVLSANKPLVK